MVKDLVFEILPNGRYAAELTSTGMRSVVQLSREEKSPVIVYMKVGGMEDYGASPAFYDAGENFMFELNLPAGIMVRVESLTSVVAGKLLEEE